MSLDQIDYELLLPSSLIGETSESNVNIKSGSVISRPRPTTSLDKTQSWNDFSETVVYSYRDQVNDHTDGGVRTENPDMMMRSKVRNSVKPCFAENLDSNPFLLDLGYEEREKLMDPESPSSTPPPTVSTPEFLSSVVLGESFAAATKQNLERNFLSQTTPRSSGPSELVELLQNGSPEMNFSFQSHQTTYRSRPGVSPVEEPAKKTARLLPKSTESSSSGSSSLVPFSAFYPPTFEEVGLTPASSSSPLMFELSLDSPKVASGSNLCPVCGNEAGKHVHYGGKACTSCRAFFRRSVQNEAYKSFACNSHGRCKIDSKSWKSCRWCRFQKCLASGMKPGYVLNETERQVRHEKRTSGGQKKQQVNPAGDFSPAMQSPIQPEEFSSTALVPFAETPPLEVRLSTILQDAFAPMASESEKVLWTFSYDEHQELYNMMTNFRKSITQTVMKFYSKNQFLFREIMKALYLRTKITYETYRQIEVCWGMWLGDMCVKHTSLGTLSPEDYSQLLKFNLPVLQVVIQSFLFGNPIGFKNSSFAEVLMRVITLQSVEYGDIDVEKEMFELNNIMSELNVGNALPERPITYEQVFHSPWAASADIEDRHEALTFQISPWPTDNSTAEVDRLQVFLLSNVIMLSTDLVKAKDTNKVAKLQDRYLSMLHRYLKYKYKRDANSKLAEGIMMSSLAREAQEIRRQRLPV